MKDLKDHERELVAFLRKGIKRMRREIARDEKLIEKYLQAGRERAKEAKRVGP